MAKAPLDRDWAGLAAGAAIGLAALAAYHNSFSGPFVFDDFLSIRDNPTIRQLWPLGPVLSPPMRGLSVSGRPILNYSLAINYALGGERVWSYHATNLAIHILAGLALFGIVRRTLRKIARPPVAPTDSRCDRSLIFALAVALIWTVHPLQTESVTYLIQRAESLMGLLYLLSLYGFIRGVDSARPAAWFSLSTAACLAGMATKEVMVSAPVMLLLYDRTFAAGGFREAWRLRRGFYLGLACTWLPLAYLVAGAGSRGGTSGFGIGTSCWAYWLTQFPAVVHYLRLSIWPHPLVLDYGTQWVRPAWTAAPYALIVILLVAGTGLALSRRPALGFLGAWFFAILAPTSVVPGNRQTMAEHRMYLALAPVVVLGVSGLQSALRRWGPGRPAGNLTLGGSEAGAKAAAVVAFAVAMGLGFMTARRNQDYRSELALWSDTVEHAPDNVSALNNLGSALAAAGRLPESIAQLERSLRIKPDFYETQNNLANALASVGRLQEAIAHYQEALRLKPDYVEVHNNLGAALFRLKRVSESIDQYETALRLKPDYVEAHFNLAVTFAHTGRLPEAISQFEEAARLDPTNAAIRHNLGLALRSAGRTWEAKAQLEAAERLRMGQTQPRP